MTESMFSSVMVHCLNARWSCWSLIQLSHRKNTPNPDSVFISLSNQSEYLNLRPLPTVSIKRSISQQSFITFSTHAYGIKLINLWVYYPSLKKAKDRYMITFWYYIWIIDYKKLARKLHCFAHKRSKKKIWQKISYINHSVSGVYHHSLKRNRWFWKHLNFLQVREEDEKHTDNRKSKNLHRRILFCPKRAIGASHSNRIGISVHVFSANGSNINRWYEKPENPLFIGP